MKLIFLPKIFCKFLIFPCTFIIAKVKIGYKIWVGTYSNRINKLGKMIWSQFSTEVFQVTLYLWYWWLGRIFKGKVIYRTEFLFALLNIHDIHPKHLKKEKEKNFKFPQECQKNKWFQTLSRAIHLEGWARHFEHEFIIKFPINLIEFWKTNEWSQCFLKRSCPLSIVSNAEFKSRVGLI